jgi:hypothetical protein
MSSWDNYPEDYIVDESEFASVPPPADDVQVREHRYWVELQRKWVAEIEAQAEEIRRLRKALEQAIEDLAAMNEIAKQNGGESLGSIQAEANIAHYRRVADRKSDNA